MGVGPPRAGLRPGLGQQPGFNIDFPHGSTRRVIHYPGTDADHYPGLALYTFVRYIRYPSSATPTYPGADLLIAGPPRSFTGISRLGASPILQLIGRLAHHVRRTILSGDGTVLNETGFASSAPQTTMPVDVSLASHSDVADLATVQLDVDLAAGAQVVDL